jgi:hypothetical protein
MVGYSKKYDIIKDWASHGSVTLRYEESPLVIGPRVVELVLQSDVGGEKLFGVSPVCGFCLSEQQTSLGRPQFKIREIGHWVFLLLRSCMAVCEGL